MFLQTYIIAALWNRVDEAILANNDMCLSLNKKHNVLLL